MVAINALLGGFGVEYLRVRDDHFCERGVEYVNLGDFYGETVLYDHLYNIFSVGTCIGKINRERLDKRIFE